MNILNFIYLENAHIKRSVIQMIWTNNTKSENK